MAAAELSSESNFETELTQTTLLTSDQRSTSPLTNAVAPHTPTHNKHDSGQEAQLEVEPSKPITQQSTELPRSQAQSTTNNSPQKTSKTIITASSSEDCQEIKNVSDDHEPGSLDPDVPRIDTVWSIGQEHSYEQRPGKRNEWTSPVDEEQRGDPPSPQLSESKENVPSFDFAKKPDTHATEVQHTPFLLCSENQVQELVEDCTVHVPQIIKIQTKASKKHFVEDDATGKQLKYLTLNGARPNTTSKQNHKTVHILKTSTPNTPVQLHSTHCLIDHNLKPLQIQHNLENKGSKSKAILCLEDIGLKYRDKSSPGKEVTAYPDTDSSSLKKSSRIDNSEKFILKEAPFDDTDYLDHADEEASCGATVYLDIDPDPSAVLNTNSQTGNGGTDNSISITAPDNSCSLQNFSMDQYLADFSDLPQFPNISFDTEDDKYTEPQHLTPSIPHDALTYDWPHRQVSWSNEYNNTSTITVAASSARTNAQPQIVSATSISLSEFMNDEAQQGNIFGGIGATGGASDNMGSMVSAFADVVSMEKHLSPGGSVPSPTLTQLNAPSVMTTATTSTITTGMTTIFKTEDQAKWDPLAECSQMPNMAGTLACQAMAGSNQTMTTGSMAQAMNNPGPMMNMPGQPLGMTSQAVSHDSSISGALMTAFDLDSHSSNMMDLQISVSVGADANTTPYPYADDGAGIGMGWSSTFLSPPPSVEQMRSQNSTPCPDESGYMTTEEQDHQSPVNLYWNQQQKYQSGMLGDDVDGIGGGGFKKMNAHTMHPGMMNCSRDGEGGYPYTHQDSHFQTLHQAATATTTSTDTVSTTTNSNDIIYYPFNDLMQLHPGHVGNEQDLSVQYVHSDAYPPSQTYPHQAGPQTYPHHHTTTQPYSQQPQPTPGRKRGRGGRPRGSGRNTLTSQIQSDQITSSLQRQLQSQMGAPPKRQYHRRNSNPDSKKKTGTARLSRSSGVTGIIDDEKKGRHNEPLHQRAVVIMQDWYTKHEGNPYPSKDEKELMAKEGGITTMQVKSWFANKRNRSNNTRPKVQKRAMEEKLMQIYTKLSKTEGADVQGGGSNSFIIKELSQIIQNRFDPETSGT